MILSTPILILAVAIITISLGLNFFFLIGSLIRRKQQSSVSRVSFDEALYVLNVSIENQKKTFFRGLYALSKKYMILGLDGKTRPPNDRVEEYSKKKKDLKIAITKKIIRNLSVVLRNRLLDYYSDYGLINYITTELDKDPEAIIGGPNVV